jgi:hypothetical protein
MRFYFHFAHFINAVTKLHRFTPLPTAFTPAASAVTLRYERYFEE